MSLSEARILPTRAILLVAALIAGASLPALATGVKSEASGGDLSAKLKGMSPEEQLRYLEPLESKRPGDPTVPFYIGNAFYSLGKLDSASVYYEKAVAVDSTFYKAYVNLGLAMDAMGRSFAAERAFTRALRVNPQDPLAHCHLGYLYYSRKRFARAMDHYRKALKADPDNAQAHYYLGLAFADAHIFKEALREWERAAQLDPEGELGKTARENAELIKQYLTVKVR